VYWLVSRRVGVTCHHAFVISISIFYKAVSLHSGHEKHSYAMIFWSKSEKQNEPY
jgi:hypothetical protein